MVFLKMKLIDKTGRLGRTLLVKDLRLIVDAIQLEKTIDKIKSLIKFWLWAIKSFLKAVEDKIFILKNSVRQSIMRELTLFNKVLIYVQTNFCNSKGETPANRNSEISRPADGSKTTSPTDDSETTEASNDDFVAIVTVVGCAARVTGIIKSLKKKHWLRFKSTTNIGALVLVLDRINKNVMKIKSRDVKSFCGFFLFGVVQDLEISLSDTQNGIRFVMAAEIIGGAVIGIAGVVLFFTPLCPLSIPLGVAGTIVLSTSVSIGAIALKCFSSAQKEVT